MKEAAPAPAGAITLSLNRLDNPAAVNQLIQLVYDDLRRLAAWHLGQSNGQHSLPPTELVHDVYLKLLGAKVEWQNREHFFNAAGGLMRWLLVDRRRAALALKRGGDQERVEWNETLLALPDAAAPDETAAFNEAFAQLEQLHPRVAHIVELRCFLGLSEAETVQALPVSMRTVRRELAFGKGWLLKRLGIKE